MKNIHVLPTEKPSRLIQAKNDILILLIELAENNKFNLNKHIYITSDEEIREDYVFAYGVIIKVMMFDVETLYFVNGTKAKREDCKKIILTTDQYLIKDGVQAIDDEFLEWFVNNSSCEYIQTEIVEYGFDEVPICIYEIIIPKEEAKQETLEEVAEKLTKNFPHYSVRDNMDDSDIKGWFLEALQKGAKWQQGQDKNKFSEEDMKKSFNGFKTGKSFEEWFE